MHVCSRRAADPVPPSGGGSTPGQRSPPLLSPTCATRDPPPPQRRSVRALPAPPAPPSRCPRDAPGARCAALPSAKPISRQRYGTLTPLPPPSASGGEWMLEILRGTGAAASLCAAALLSGDPSAPKGSELGRGSKSGFCDPLLTLRQQQKVPFYTSCW